jgi:hypothetical protein
MRLTLGSTVPTLLLLLAAYVRYCPGGSFHFTAYSRGGEQLGRFAMQRVSATRAVRVATLNLWGQHGAWEVRRSVLADGLRELQPDIIAFQEAVVTNAYDQVADLLGASYRVVHQAERICWASGR